MSGPDIPAGVCDTPVSLLDVSATIPETFGLSALNEAEGKSLRKSVKSRKIKTGWCSVNITRLSFVSGGFMLRKGRFKLIHYVGFAPELADLNIDPEEITNLSEHQDFSSIRDELYAELKAICDPEAVDERAHDDRQALVDGYGGFEIAKTLGARAATPPPERRLMKITCLGTGTPESHMKQRASSGYLVEIGDDRILLDCGGGVVSRLIEARLSPVTSPICTAICIQII